MGKNAPSNAGTKQLGEKSAYFSEASQRYAQKRSKLIGLLVEVDFYFSDAVIAHANRYYRHISAAGNVTVLERINFWEMAVQEIAIQAASGSIDLQRTAVLLQQRMNDGMEAQKLNVSLYNNVYDAMRREITPYK